MPQQQLEVDPEPAEQRVASSHQPKANGKKEHPLQHGQHQPDYSQDDKAPSEDRAHHAPPGPYRLPGAV